jgi:hypothetical protein
VKPSRSELPFAAFLSYCPRGDGSEIARSQRLVRQLKDNRVVRYPEWEGPIGSFVARRLRETQPSFLSEFLGAKVALVPVPRSGMRLAKADALWPSLEIAKSLRAEGFGLTLLECLERARAVPKAATSKASERPKARLHFDSLTLLKPLELPRQVTLVDDVVTRGAQLFGAAWRIWQQRPDVVVRAFAVMRTVSDAADFVTILDPRTGRIEWRAEECYRDP